MPKDILLFLGWENVFLVSLGLVKNFEYDAMFKKWPENSAPNSNEVNYKLSFYMRRGTKSMCSTKHLSTKK